MTKPTTPDGHAFPPDDQLLSMLQTWMPQQRWFSAKGSIPRLDIVGRADISTPGLTAQILLVQDSAGSAPVLYQVPLVTRPHANAAARGALVGHVGDLVLVDLCQDAEGAMALLDLIFTQKEIGYRPDEYNPDSLQVAGFRSSGAGAVRSVTSIAQVTHARLMSGEQSNSSIVFTTEGAGPDLIGKVFRTVQEGINPDIEIQEALAGADCTLVPAPLGDITGRWHHEDELRAGDLFFVQEFIPGAKDAWQVATVAAAEGRSFADRAHALGRATAEVHSLLAQEMATAPADSYERDELLSQWEQRLTAAIEAVPELAGHEEQMRQILAAGADDDWPELQRVHGDFHLGQVLDVPERGWVLLDFEGEPLRPLSERVEPDLAVRDVAGMLRSFDYAAGSVMMTGTPAHRAEDWAAQARAGFLAGYAERVSPVSDPRQHPNLLSALELDKALYEVVYEVRNRPDWLDVPLGGIRRILHNHS